MEVLTIPAGANCYVVIIGEKTMMIDSGDPASRQKIEHTLQGNNIDMNNISYLFLTHGHIDHIGNAAYFQKKYGMKVLMHENDLELIGDNFSQPMSTKHILGVVVKMFAKMSVKKNPLEPFIPDVVIKNPEEVSLGFGETIHLMPGHTQGSIGISFPTGELFGGDLFMNMVRPHGSYVWENYSSLQQSINYAKKLPVHIIYLGHGKPISI